jgi:hypothetical protein
MASEKDCRRLVRETLVDAAAEHRRYLTYCLHDEFEHWETEVEYHGWMKAEEVLKGLAESLVVSTEGVAEEAAKTLREEYERRMARAPGLLAALQRREDAIRRSGEPGEALARRLSTIWQEQNEARVALQYGPAILYALDHDGELEGYEPPPTSTPSRKEGAAP